MAAENVLRPFQIAATGTITTDGALGVLSQSDITALNITVGDGTHSFALTLPDLLFSGSDLSATSGGLFFNHAAVDGGFFGGVKSQTNVKRILRRRPWSKLRVHTIK